MDYLTRATAAICDAIFFLKKANIEFETPLFASYADGSNFCKIDKIADGKFWTTEGKILDLLDISPLQICSIADIVANYDRQK